ncbi:chorismate synthase, partial [Faecalibaculum rodentium]
MSDTFGTLLKLTIFGESHGRAIGAVLTGLPAGLPVDMDRLEQDMDRRRAKGRISTQRHEPDQVQVLSGVFEGRTAGTAVTLMIENKVQRSADYDQLKYRLRPGHADLAAFARYNGCQ